jgi:uncharacterized iron-regulated protein
MNRLFLAAALLLLAGCASSPKMPPFPARVAALLPADALLLGEQHDADDHHRIEREVVSLLATQGTLAAVALEMAERGKSTAGLPRDAPETAVQEALAWNDNGWPWRRYGPTVMTAVRAGVPVLGANLPRDRMRAAMQDTALDTRLDTIHLERQRQAIREGHCGLLPEAQTAPMTRIQIARDEAMAATLVAARQAGKTVVLVAGGGHVLRDRGIPRHLPAGFNARVLLMRAGAAQEPEAGAADLIEQTPALPPTDYCASLRK